MNLLGVITALIILVIAFNSGWYTQNLSEALSIIIELILTASLMFGGAFLTRWIVYHNTIKAFYFMSWLFRMKEVYAGWYNNKILLRVRHSNGIDDYSLQGFVENIENELVITDKSDRNKPIHIFIDITSNEKTEVTIENVEK